jgi:plasmid stability protein
MPALTIRNLPGDVHTRLRERAAAAQVSVEGLIRRTLADVVTAQPEDRKMAPTGFGEVSLPLIHAAANGSAGAMPELWGALKGSVRIETDTDLTAPTGEVWSAEA